MASLLPQWEILGLPVSLPILFITLFAVILIPVVLSQLLSSKSKDGPSSFFLLAGPRDSGKTSFLLYLQEQTLIPTQTSTTSATVKLPTGVLEQIKSEDGETSIPEDIGSRHSFHLKDTPGHPKLRSQALTSINLGPKACIGIIFMLDSAVLSSQPRLTDTVEYLYELLLVIQKQYNSLSESSASSPDPIPLLIACNKNDLFTALPSAKISILLQTELGRMKETKRKGLLNAGAGEEDDEDLDRVLGDENSDHVTWEGLREFGVEISVQSGSIKSTHAESWKSWMSSCLDA
ncbi:Signal recognition particle subunit [Drechslerella dactyloides]|uniref:Signal recognition particle receptor subunit beta n=1 Tax=Drechslerella dactyloides TaxID=74499 RepID=A0AAD6J2B6_DREDA|nr:Signal recognition particle subunit [Drechslerella dactyloides]